MLLSGFGLITFGRDCQVTWMVNHRVYVSVGGMYSLFVFLHFKYINFILQ